MPETFLEQLGQFGLLGIVLAIVAWAAIHLWRDLRSSWEARISDNKQLAEVVEATNRTYVSLSQSIDNRARAIETVAEAQDAMAKALEYQVELLRKIENNDRELTRSLDRLMTSSEQITRHAQELLTELRK